MEDDHSGRRISKEDEAGAVKPTRSFRYEDYSTRRVFLRSYPLQWDASDEKQQGQLGDPPSAAAAKHGEEDEDDGYGSRGERRKWKRQVVVAVVEWGEEKMLLLRRVKKRLALYLLGCHYGSRPPALPFKSGGSCTTAMLKTS